MFNRHQFNQRRRKSAEEETVLASELVVGAAETRVKSAEKMRELDECESRATTVTMYTPVASVSSSLSTSSTTSSTNFEQFLEYTTPSVRAQYFAKTSMKGWRTPEDEFRPYFVLGDLWESFKEWSVYGAGGPLLLNGINSVVQYYVPYLSGIQLYVDPSKPSPITRRLEEESDESSIETSSIGSSDCEIELGPNSFDVWGPHEIAESNQQGIKELSVSSDEAESSCSPGALIFEYFERDPPFSSNSSFS